MIEWLFCYTTTFDSMQQIDWEEEAAATEDAGFNCHSFHIDRFMEGDYYGALAELPEGDGQSIVYRGWMLTEDEYICLEDGLFDKGYHLQTNSYQYVQALRLPNWHELIEDLTPPAIWTWDRDPATAWEAAQSQWAPPYVVKDHTKSFKEEWSDAFFVEADADEAEFTRICENLVMYRGERFDTGFVVRPVVPLKFMAAHYTGVPVYEEYRLIFWHGELLLAAPYGELDGGETDFSQFEELGSRIDSPFFVADVARTAEGNLILIEINDAGVAGLPVRVHSSEFYEAVAAQAGLQ